MTDLGRLALGTGLVLVLAGAGTLPVQAATVPADGPRTAAVQPRVEVSTTQLRVNEPVTLTMPGCDYRAMGTPSADAVWETVPDDTGWGVIAYFESYDQDPGPASLMWNPGYLGRPGRTHQLGGFCEGHPADPEAPSVSVDATPVSVYIGYPRRMLTPTNYSANPGATREQGLQDIFTGFELGTSVIRSNRISTNVDGTGYRMMVQTDGNLVVYAPDNRVLWQSNTRFTDPDDIHFSLDESGRAVLTGASRDPNKMDWDYTELWASPAAGPGAELRIQEDGNLVLYSAADRPVWFTGVDSRPTAPTNAQLSAGQTLAPGQSRVSADGRFRLVMQTDGNLVLYTAANRPLWNSRTNGRTGARAVMQGDGNFVVYTPDNTPRWWSGTRGDNNRLVVQNDGNLVLYSSTNKALWATYTRG